MVAVSTTRTSASMGAFSGTLHSMTPDWAVVTSSFVRKRWKVEAEVSCWWVVVFEKFANLRWSGSEVVHLLSAMLLVSCRDRAELPSKLSATEETTVGVDRSGVKKVSRGSQHDVSPHAPSSSLH